MKRNLYYLIIIFGFTSINSIIAMNKNPPLCTLSASYMWACDRPDRENKYILIEYIKKLNESKKTNIPIISKNSSQEEVIASVEKLLKFCHNCEDSYVNGVVVEQVHAITHAIAKK